NGALVVAAGIRRDHAPHTHAVQEPAGRHNHLVATLDLSARPGVDQPKPLRGHLDLYPAPTQLLVQLLLGLGQHGLVVRVTHDCLLASCTRLRSGPTGTPGTTRTLGTTHPDAGHALRAAHTRRTSTASARPGGGSLGHPIDHARHQALHPRPDRCDQETVYQRVRLPTPPGDPH